MNYDLYIITGCTAVGKSEYAINFAKENNAEIVSCDSLAVYKHMNIGTAKPTEQEQRGIKHYCMDIVEPCEKFNVAMFIESAKSAINSILNKKKNVVIVGGSGFYLKSFFFPVIDDLEIPLSVERFVNSEYLSKGLNGLVTMLTRLNGSLPPAIDLKNPRRVISALKRCLTAKKTCDEIYKNFAELRPPFDEYKKRTILLERNQHDLEKRVYIRIEAMFASGLIDETKMLVAKYGKSLNASASQAIGYREIMKWLQNPTTPENLICEIAKNTLKLIKKQRTWLKNQIPFDDKILLS